MTNNHITFLVDNQILARAANSKNLRQEPGHWDIRHQLTAFFDIMRHNEKVFHIPRIHNFRAHDCATNANLIDSQDSPKLACCNNAHAGEHCPTLMKLGNLQMKDCKIIAVICT